MSAFRCPGRLPGRGSAMRVQIEQQCRIVLAMMALSAVAATPGCTSPTAFQPLTYGAKPWTPPPGWDPATEPRRTTRVPGGLLHRDRKLRRLQGYLVRALRRRCLQSVCLWRADVEVPNELRVAVSPGTLLQRRRFSASKLVGVRRLYRPWLGWAAIAGRCGLIVITIVVPS